MKIIFERIAKLDYQNMNVLDVFTALNKEYAMNDIQKTLTVLKDGNKRRSKNEFGKCGIDPDVNPCGDADEY